MKTSVTTFFTALSIAALSVKAALTVSEPSSDRWWIAKSINTLRWDGSDPAQFSVFLYNSDPELLTSALALTSITNAYMVSLSVNPGEIRPGTGYVVQLTDILNSTNIYAQSSPFEIKPQGSAYPSQTAAAGGSASGSTVIVSATNTGPGASVSSAAARPSGAAERTIAGAFGLVAGLAAWAVVV